MCVSWREERGKEEGGMVLWWVSSSCFIFILFSFPWYFLQPFSKTHNHQHHLSLHNLHHHPQLQLLTILALPTPWSLKQPWSPWPSTSTALYEHHQVKHAMSSTTSTAHVKLSRFHTTSNYLKIPLLHWHCRYCFPFEILFGFLCNEITASLRAKVQWTFLFS